MTKDETTHMDGVWLVDTILPGFIEAHSGRQFGEPTVINDRYPCSAGWAWEYLDDPEKASMTREQIIAACAFEAGRDWQRSRKRRQRIQQAVHDGWEKVREHDSAEAKALAEQRKVRRASLPGIGVSQ